MNVTVSNVLTIENPTQDALMWCKHNLTITNPEYTKKARMHFWLGNTPATLTLYETRGNTLILPFGTLRNLPDCIAKESTFQSAFSTPVSVSYGGVDIPLYDYQKTAVDALYAAKYGILQSAAGSGKTQMGIALVKRFESAPCGSPTRSTCSGRVKLVPKCIWTQTSSELSQRVRSI